MKTTILRAARSDSGERSGVSPPVPLFCTGRLTHAARAPVKAIEQLGESPDRGTGYVPVVEGNCVFNRKGGEQPEANEQSVTKVPFSWRIQ